MEPTNEVAHEHERMKRPSMVRIGVTVLLSNGAVLVLQLVAGRLLSPFTGVSLATWTAVIGVTLAGISAGNWIGGRVADRRSSPAMLGQLLLGGVVSMLFVLVTVHLLGTGDALRPLPLMPRIVLLTTLLILPTSLILSVITPVAIRLRLRDVHETGSIVGSIYALGTVGSLVGNFLTGFVLVAHLTLNQIVLGTALALLVPAIDWLASARFARSAGAQREPCVEAGASVAAPAQQHSSLVAKWWDIRANLPLACVVVAVTSACAMSTELAASRVLAPRVGVSLYSWTVIIGVVLIAIATGNYLGGRLGDRWPRPAVLGASLILAGLGCLGILLLVGPLTAGGPATGSGLIERIIALAAPLFFLPVMLMSMISPQITRLTLVDLSRAGRIAGRIYACSTAGAIFGTLGTGWFLISLLGVNRLIYVCGAVLLLLGLLVSGLWRAPWRLAAAALLAGAAMVGVDRVGVADSECTLETNYYCIKVSGTLRDANEVRVLQLDHLVHSMVKPADPSYLGYEHEQVQVDITRWLTLESSNPSILVIGGGGYTYPRWVDANLPDAKVEVVEIDPGVTEIAYRELGLPRDTSITSYNMDGRQFVTEIAARGQYRLVVQDAVNDLSVPYHILTREYNDSIREILTPDGVYLLTIIDLYEDGRLLRAAVRTMMKTFPEVRLLAARPLWDTSGSGVYLVYGSQRPLDIDEQKRSLEAHGFPSPHLEALPAERLRQYVAEGSQVVLSDQYAPVDDLISALVRRRR